MSTDIVEMIMIALNLERDVQEYSNVDLTKCVCKKAMKLGFNM